MRMPTSMKALEKLGRVRLSAHFFMRDMLYSEIASFHGIPNIPDDPRSGHRGGNAFVRGVAGAASRHLRARLDPFRVPVRGRQRLRHRAQPQGLQLQPHVMDSCAPRMGPAGRRRVHGRYRVHRPSRGSLSATKGGTPWQALAWWIHDHLPLLRHDVLSHLRGGQSAVARAAGPPDRQLRCSTGRPHASRAWPTMPEITPWSIRVSPELRPQIAFDPVTRFRYGVCSFVCGG